MGVIVYGGRPVVKDRGGWLGWAIPPGWGGLVLPAGAAVAAAVVGELGAAVVGRGFLFSPLESAMNPVADGILCLRIQSFPVVYLGIRIVAIDVVCQTRGYQMRIELVFSRIRMVGQ